MIKTDKTCDNCACWDNRLILGLAKGQGICRAKPAQYGMAVSQQGMVQSYQQPITTKIDYCVESYRPIEKVENGEDSAQVEEA